MIDNQKTSDPIEEDKTNNDIRFADKLKNKIDKISENKKFNKSLKNVVNIVDHSIDFITNDNSKLNRNDVIQIARKPILFGIWTCFITFVICGLWAGFAPINSASVASGIVVVESDKKIVQHLEGGIVSKILVKNGDIVETGQPLIVLDDTKAKAALDSVLTQLRTLQATKSRLIAERDNKDEIDFDSELLQDQPGLNNLIDTQRRLFKIKSDAINGKIQALNKKIDQQRKLILSNESQLNSTKLQLKYNQEQLEDVQQLIKNSYTTKSKLLDIQSRVAHYEGNIGELVAKIAAANHAINETEIEIINQKTDFINNTVKELKEVQTQVSYYEEEAKSKRDTLNRTIITAQQDGIINNLQIHTIGGVISPQGGQRLLEIIPQNEKLVIDVYIRPQDIDLVNIGMTASVKLQAYKSRTTPSLDGVVVHVSAETIQNLMDQGRPYYQARIEIDEEQFAKKNIKNLKLYPGMPASVFIVTGSRTLLRYILDPVIDSIRKSFRER